MLGAARAGYGAPGSGWNRSLFSKASAASGLSVDLTVAPAAPHWARRGGWRAPIVQKMIPTSAEFPNHQGTPQIRPENNQGHTRAPEGVRVGEI